jgi:hypothetical protein
VPHPYRIPLTTDSKPTREGQKTRRFHADLLALVLAPTLWDLGAAQKDRTRTLRPVFMAYAASDLEARAFTANLRAGHPAVQDQAQRSPSTASPTALRLEVPRSAGFRFDPHSRDGATLTLAYLPAAFTLQPATAEPAAIRFLFMPPTWWIDREAATLPELGADAREAALAACFVAHLDRRTPLPIASDLRFHLALYRAARAAGWCHESEISHHAVKHLHAAGCEALGFEPPLVVSTTRADFSAFLARQTAHHLPQLQTLQEDSNHGPTFLPSPRRLLPDTAPDPAQHRLAG